MASLDGSAIRCALDGAGGDRQVAWRSLRSKGYSNASIMQAFRSAVAATMPAANASDTNTAFTNASAAPTTENRSSGVESRESASQESKGDLQDASVEALADELKAAVFEGRCLDAGIRVRGLNPLMFASSAYDEDLAMEVLKVMPEECSWLIEPGDYGYTSLHYACESGSLSLVEAILQCATRRSSSSSSGTEEEDNVVVRADAQQHFEAPNDPVQQGGDDSPLAVLLKAQTTDMHLQKAVVQAGGQSALHLAAVNGRVDVVRLLLTHGANPNSSDYEKNTPLLRAAMKRSLQDNGSPSAANAAPSPSSMNGSLEAVIDALLEVTTVSTGAEEEPPPARSAPASNYSCDEEGDDDEEEEGQSAKDAPRSASSSSASSIASSFFHLRANGLPSAAWLREKAARDAQRARARVHEAWAVPRHHQAIRSFPGFLSGAECDRLVRDASRAAAARGGWHGDRHRGYATTDLRVAHVSAEVDAFVRSAVTSRLFPILRAHFSSIECPSSSSSSPTVAPAADAPQPVDHRAASSFSLRDLFFVKYEAKEGEQRAVGLHRDGSSLSFNVLLNHASDFVGGGTYFDYPVNKTFKIDKGAVLVHSGKRSHAGVEITSGRRFLLVGFIDLASEPAIELHFQDHTP